MIDVDFSLKLIKWYLENKRDLPWRITKDPYHIWISEIILQQTRVDQGLPYYFRFSEKFPNVVSLANADEEEVLKLWQGLGYYSRARNLHYTAKYISNNLDGKFPKKYKDLIKLKGIGEYTAAAISSFAFNEKRAVVDGNVFRVLSRYFGLFDAIDSSKGKKKFQELAFNNLPKINIDTYNQSIMEFGALQCKPVNPNCENCVLQDKCWGYLNEKIKDLPLKEKKLKVRERYFNFIVMTDKDCVLIEKRISNDIWKNLYQFPLFETKSEKFTPAEKFIKKSTLVKKYKTTHKLSHQKLIIVFWHYFSKESIQEDPFKKIKLKNLTTYPVPKIVENYIMQNTSDFRL
jgi:A/G-specific adenine glycosylase